jgi:aspartate/methionine/tyrosine aminotransferase
MPVIEISPKWSDAERAASRIARLGTETAFAVSAEAMEYAAKGFKVYPFHLGDMNIATPPNIVEAAFKAIKDGKTGYCSNYGLPSLREALAENVRASHGIGYTHENVAIQPGGKPVISKFILALMNPGDGVLYPSPGYPIYESQIEFHGGVGQPYSFVEEGDHFALDMESLERQITPQTRLLILNNLQNPTGAECTPQELEHLADLVIRHDLLVLADEAYFDIYYGKKASSIASFPGLAERCVILYTFSKKFAMTGWRLGAAIGPKWIIDIIAKLSVNDESCTNHFIQYGALEGLTGDQSYPKQILEILRTRRDLAAGLLNSIKGVRCFRPNATFYLFPNVTRIMQQARLTDYEEFRRALLHNAGVSVCTRLHFGRKLPHEKEYYIRFAYSGIESDIIREGLGKLKMYIESL